jgi:phosphoglycerate kinase
MKKTIRDLDARGKRVFVRVDFNVPQDENGNITDDRRIVASLPTVEYLQEQGAIQFLASHLGRPKGKRDPKYSLSPCAERLGELLGKSVPLIPDCKGEEVSVVAASAQEGDVFLLENVRFYAEEEQNDADFARDLAAGMDVYVNDAFGSAHRAHASTEGIAHILPAYAGFLMEAELRYLGEALTNPKRPFVAILGGAKISDKIPVIENLIGNVDHLLIGGGMAYTFLRARGLGVGTSLVDEGLLSAAAALLDRAGDKIHLPTDSVIAQDTRSGTSQVVSVTHHPDGWMGVDIGPQTVSAYASVIEQAGTVVWNGPMGVFETPQFARGTKAIAEAVAANQSCISVVGGGDSAAAIEQLGYAERITHISTGGGASLEFLEGKELPGVAALLDA